MLLRSVHPVPQPELLALLASVESWTGKVEHQSRDGRRIIVESRQQAIAVDGETLILETNRDITERERAEYDMARMAAVASASHDVFYEAGLNGVIETWNPAAEQLFGHMASAAIGQHLRMLAPASRHAEQLDFLARVAAGESIQPVQTQRTRKDGTLVNVSVAKTPIKSPDGKVIAISIVIHDLSERLEWEARQKTLTRELAHRVKNSFAVLQAILRSTLKHTSDPAKFAAAFSGRVHSLSVAQDILTASDWKHVELGALTRHQLSTSAISEGDQLAITGPPVKLGAEHSAPLALLFNELASNALKFGALSVPFGRVELNWRVENDGGATRTLIITWRETGGPKITHTGVRGFGFTLIEKGLPGANVESRFEPEGLVCKVELEFTPLEYDVDELRINESVA